MNTFGNKWEQLYKSQYFDERLLDYSIVEQHKQLLDYLSDTGNSASFIFDLYKQQYIYASRNFNEILGTDLRMLASDEGMQIIDNLLHPMTIFSLNKCNWTYIHFCFLFLFLIRWIINIFIHSE